MHLPEWSPLWKTEKELNEWLEILFENVIDHWWNLINAQYLNMYYNELKNIQNESLVKSSISTLKEIKDNNITSNETATKWNKTAIWISIISWIIAIWAIVFAFLDFQWDKTRQDEQLRLLEEIRDLQKSQIVENLE